MLPPGSTQPLSFKTLMKSWANDSEMSVLVLVYLPLASSSKDSYISPSETSGMLRGLKNFCQNAR